MATFQHETPFTGRYGTRRHMACCDDCMRKATGDERGSSRLLALSQFGQSVWLDNISRGLITGGGLRRLIDEDGVRGITSNPAIFAKAITEGADYDEVL